MIPSFDDQIQWGLALTVFLLAALLHLALVPVVTLFGGHADIFLVVVTTWALVRSPEEAMLAGPPAALLVGLLGAGPIGTPILALMPPVGLAILLRNGGALPRLPSVGAVMAAVSVAAPMLELVVQFLGGARSFDFAGLASVFTGAILLNVLLAAMIYWPMKIGRKRKLVRRARLSLS